MLGMALTAALFLLIVSATPLLAQATPAATPLPPAGAISVAGDLTATVPLTNTASPSAAEANAQVREALRAVGVSGSLPNQYSAHYLGLRPVESDQPVTLLLSFDPQDPTLAGLVNFVVLDEDGLRRFLAGADPMGLDIAAGSPVQFTGAINVVEGQFLASGQGSYTVIVYNESTQPVTYALAAQNGVLLDNAGQVAADAANVVPEPTPTPAPAPYGPVSVTGRRLSAELDGEYERHYLGIVPEMVDGTVDLRFQYQPLDRPELVGNVNFWVLDAEGMKSVVMGRLPSEVNLATGFQAPFGALGDLLASFDASGDGEYTAVVFNESGIPATYALGADGALLVDRYGQTNEAAGALAEQEALAAQPAPTATPTPAGIDVTQPELAAPALPFRLQGALDTPYEKHYFGLVPNIQNGAVTIKLDVDPKDVEALQGKVNFWVIDSDSLRRVIAGARPQDFAIATGMLVTAGPDEGKLRADFTSSGRDEYTLIVYTDAEVPATYKVETPGAGLLDGLGQAQVWEP